jgi:hypothetical protein
LPRKNALKPIIVASGSEDGRVRGERQSGEATPISAQPYDKLRRKVQGIGSASAVSEEDNFPAAAQGDGTFFGELCDASD